MPQLTSVPVPASRSHTQILPFTPRLTQRPSESASVDTGPTCPCSVRTNVSLGNEELDGDAGRCRRYSWSPDALYMLDDTYVIAADDGDDGDGEGEGEGEDEDELDEAAEAGCGVVTSGPVSPLNRGRFCPGARMTHLPSV